MFVYLFWGGAGVENKSPKPRWINISTRTFHFQLIIIIKNTTILIGILLLQSTFNVIEMHHTALKLCSLAAPIVYPILTITAILSLFSPFLSQLASHGKTRIVRVGKQVPERNRGGAKHGDRNGTLLPVGNKERPHIASKSSSSILAFLDHPRLQISKRHFVHFYSVGILWTALVYFVYPLSSQTTNLNVSRVTLFIHLTRRCYECRYVHQWNGTMHIAGFLLGLLHYILLPFIFLPEAYLIPTSIESIAPNTYANSGWKLLRLLFGITMNLYSQHQQYIHHCLLANCRTRNRQDINIHSGEKRKNKYESVYTIPRGKWFAYVSCPHYLAEIMIYVSFAILLHPLMLDSSMRRKVVNMDDAMSDYYFGGGNTDIVTMTQYVINVCYVLRPCKHIVLVVWVAVNLAVSARSSHEWYRVQFPDYPLHRAALIPFIW